MYRPIIALFLMSFLESVSANVDAQIARMLQAGQQLSFYQNQDLGRTVISIGYGMHRNKNAAIDMAKQDAMKQLTGFLKGEKISANEVVEQKYVGDHAEESYYQSMKSNIEGTLKSAYLFKSGDHDGMKYAVVIISERSRDMAGIFADRQSSDLITAKGFASLSEGMAKARQLALEQALRSAVEQYSGVQMASKASVENAETYRGRLSAVSKGVVKRYKVLNEGQQGTSYAVEIAAQIVEDDQTSGQTIEAVKENMGRPAFLIQADDGDIKRMLSEVFNDGDLEVTENQAAAKYIVRATIDRHEYPAMAGMTGMQTTISIKVKEKFSDDDFLNISNDPEKSVEISRSDTVRRRNSYAYAIDDIKEKLTAEIHRKFNSRFNNGSKVLVKLQDFDRMRDVNELKDCIDALPLTKSVSLRPVEGRSVVYEVMYLGNPSDLQLDIMKKSREFRLRGLRTKNVNDGLITFRF